MRALPDRAGRRVAPPQRACSAGVSHLDIRCVPATSPTGGGSSPRAARSGASTAGIASECRRGTARRCSAGRIVCSGEGWGSEGTGDRHRRPASLRARMRCHAATRISDESPSLHLAWRSRGDTRVAIHPSTSVSSQPTVFVVSWRLEGNCPRHSRRQSVIRDSPVRVQTSRHRRKRAGERAACAGCSAASFHHL
jgi:hypothetical protein